MPVGTRAGIAVILPAWQPTAALPALVTALADARFGGIVVIDDGSSPDHRPLFEALRPLPSVHLLRHQKNRGKGRSLKTGLAYVASLSGITGCVTADADGQHTPIDIVRVAEHFAAAPHRPVLGIRTFGPEVPWRSRLGNRLTQRLFRFATGISLADTQTGLRAFPQRLFADLLACQGERYEYEMSVLAHLCRTGDVPDQVPIETVYLDENRGSHFHPLWDSLRVYRALTRSTRRS